MIRTTIVGASFALLFQTLPQWLPSATRHAAPLLRAIG